MAGIILAIIGTLLVVFGIKELKEWSNGSETKRSSVWFYCGIALVAIGSMSVLLSLLSGIATTLI